ncbi:hypothetical protein [Gracilimonas sp.]|uniref:hypothetical protein n=1 Tax=Gracilimonas sp. TaxID=1974203 RepID=UPI0032F0996E
MSGKVTSLLVMFITLGGSIIAQTQSYEAEFSVGYSSTSATDLKKLQAEVISSQNFEYKVTDNFPATPYLNLAIFKNLEDGNRVGLFWRYLSTGGRLTVSDYSGTLTSDQILTNHEIGADLNIYLKEFPQKLVRPFVELQISALLSRLEMKDKAVIINSGEQSESLSLVAQNVAITPSLGFEVIIKNHPIRFKAGYLIEVTQFPFHLKENRDAKLRISNDNTVGPGLTGLRIGVGSAIGF